MTCIIGIDPGLTGAIAVVGADIAEVVDMPTCSNGSKTATVKTKVDAPALVETLLRMVEQYGCTRAIVEQVATRPGQGVATNGSLMHSLGIIEGVLAGIGVEVQLVRPQVWKAGHGLIGEEKDASLTLARTLCPGAPLHLKKHHNRAEALLIAIHGVHR